jgi:uncharacterized protein YbaP (TraB family)
MDADSILHKFGSKRERDGSRGASIIVAIVLDIAALYMLFRLLYTIDVPASPTVEPTVAYLISQVPPLQHPSELKAIHPRLVEVPLQPLDTPLNLNIVIPVPLIRPTQPSDIAVSSSPGNKPTVSETLSQGLVTGEQPGPGLWKITSGQHVLWVLGKPPTPLPKQVVWRSKEVETTLASTQELILDDDIAWDPKSADVSERARLIEQFQDIHTLPGGQTLKDVVPEDLYARFEALKTAFNPKDGGMEHQRPWAAAIRLRNDALQSLNLTDDAIFRTVRRDAGWGTHETDVVTDADFEEFLRNGVTNRSVSCLGATVSALEADRDSLRRLANAWATGDIGTLRQLVTRQQAFPCLPALFDSDQRAKDIVARHREQLLAATEQALKARKTTFAVVSMDELFAPDGWLATLRARGYGVKEPAASKEAPLIQLPSQVAVASATADTAGAASATVTPSDAADFSQPVVWTQRRLFVSFEILPQCHLLAGAVKPLLLELGARTGDLQIDELNCPASHGLEVTFSVLAKADAAGKHAATKVFQGHWQNVEIKLEGEPAPRDERISVFSSRRTSSKKSRQQLFAALVRQEILPLFSTRTLELVDDKVLRAQVLKLSEE